MKSTFGDTGAQEPLSFRVARENRPGAHQRWRRHHEADRPDEADPFQVRVDVRSRFSIGYVGMSRRMTRRPTRL